MEKEGVQGMVAMVEGWMRPWGRGSAGRRSL